MSDDALTIDQALRVCILNLGTIHDLLIDVLETLNDEADEAGEEN